MQDKRILHSSKLHVAMRTPAILRFSVRFALISILLAGCAQERESLHEHEHDAPNHWPESMGEAAEFIESRVKQLSEQDAESRGDIENELRDLVEWAPEVAADTVLEEQDWVPIYELSEAIRKHLKDDAVGPQDLAGDFEKLASLLLDGHAKVLLETKARDVTVDEQPQ